MLQSYNAALGRGDQAAASALRNQAQALVARLRPLEDKAVKDYDNAQAAFQHGLDLGKGKEREAMLSQRAREAGTYLCYVNGVGGQDELVFDGQSLVFDPSGRLVARACQFEEQLLIVDLDPDPRPTGRNSQCAPSAWPVEIIPVRRQSTRPQ
jgi:hypothetical protein